VGLLGSFFGSDQKKTLAAAKVKSDAALKEGFTGANANLEQAYDLYSPYAQQGATGSKAYSDAIGLGSQEDQAAIQGRYLADPMQQAQLGQASNALLRNLNARGAGQGVQALAGNRVATENYGNWLNRLQGVGQQGFQATGAQAGVRGAQSDLSWGYGASRAGQETNYGNAKAAAQGIGVNNLLGLFSAGAKAYSAFSGGK
jgi:hypothetical protein